MKSEFSGKVIVECLTKEESEESGKFRNLPLFRLQTEIGYFSESLNETICIPKEFVTDFASIPRPLWAIYSPDDFDVQRPSIVHDWLCEHEGRIVCDNGRIIRLSPKQSSEILVEAMKIEGASWIKRKNFFWATYIFGPKW